MNFLKVGEYLEAGDQVEIYCSADPNTYIQGRVKEITEEEIILEYKRYTDIDPQRAKLQRVAAIINREDIYLILKIEPD